MILKKISKIGATRRQILRLKSISAGALPQTPLGELIHAPPGPLAVFKEPTSKGKEGEGGEEGRRREGKREGKGRTTLHTPCRKFLATPLATPLLFRLKFEGVPFGVDP